MSHPRHFFIVGTPRSGTTLLQSMLARAPGVRIPPETHFLGITWSRRRRMGDIATDAGWEAAKTNIRRRSESVHIPVDWDAFEGALADAPRTYANLLRAWLDAIARSADPPPRLLGEKSPGHTPFVPELLVMGRGAVAIQIVRDPRDVAPSSARHMGTSVDETITNMADEDHAIGKQFEIPHILSSWSNHVRSWGSGDPQTVLVRFEALRTAPSDALHRMLVACNVRPDVARIARAVEACSLERLMAQEDERGFIEASQRTERFFGSGKGWEQELTPEQAQRIGSDHGEMMQAMGYR